MIPIIRAFDAATEVSDGERSVVAKVNTACVDRYGTVIEPGGIDLTAYRTNPVILWMHGMGNEGLPVARAAWIKYLKAEDALIAKAIFLEDEFSQRIFQNYQIKALRSFSVNIIPKSGGMSSPTVEEIRKRPELAECWMVYRKSELVEFSAVNVPGNSEALALAVSRGIWKPSELGSPRATAPALTPAQDLAPPAPADPVKAPEPVLPRLVGRTLAQVAADRLTQLRRSIPAEAARAAQDRLDLLCGKV